VTEPSSPNEPDSREFALLVGMMFGVASLVLQACWNAARV